MPQPMVYVDPPAPNRCAHCGATRGPSGCCRELDGDIAFIAQHLRAWEAKYQRAVRENSDLLRALDRARADRLRREAHRSTWRGRIVAWLERVLGL